MEDILTLERLIVTHSSPTLANIKCSSLFCTKLLDSFSISSVENLKKKGISLLFLTNRRGCPLLFVYREKELFETINKKRNKSFLNSFGYDTTNLNTFLIHFKERMRNDDFPHEIGVILGYPIEDVLSFIENKGKNSVYSGYWKVYHNKNKALKQFEKFENCRKEYIARFNSGNKVEDLCV